VFRNLKENACFDNSDLYRLVRYSKRKITDEEINEFLKRARKDENYNIIGYYENEIIVGLLIYKIENDSAYIEVISVEKDERGKGIGTKLLNQIHETHKNVKVEAECDSLSVGFYKGLGFEILNNGKNYYEEDLFRCIDIEKKE